MSILGVKVCFLDITAGWVLFLHSLCQSVSSYWGTETTGEEKCPWAVVVDSTYCVVVYQFAFLKLLISWVWFSSLDGSFLFSAFSWTELKDRYCLSLVFYHRMPFFSPPD